MTCAGSISCLRSASARGRTTTCSSPPDHREADAQLQVEPRLRITRKTKLSALAVDASLRRSIYARLHDQDTTEYGLRAAFRRGNDQAALAAEAGYRREVIQRGSVENDLTAGPPLLRRVLDGALTGHKRFNRFALDARAGVTWLRYESVDGATSDQRFRDGERYEGQLVASFDISARTSVFAAGAYQRFDYRRSPAIGNRDADDWSGLIGVRYDLSRALIAQVGGRGIAPTASSIRASAAFPGPRYPRNCAITPPAC
ncbi:outer membrane beta-barrel protein [Novosphingobium colocasiae]